MVPVAVATPATDFQVVAPLQSMAQQLELQARAKQEMEDAARAEQLQALVQQHPQEMEDAKRAWSQAEQLQSLAEVHVQAKQEMEDATQAWAKWQTDAALTSKFQKIAQKQMADATQAWSKAWGQQQKKHQEALRAQQKQERKA